MYTRRPVCETHANVSERRFIFERDRPVMINTRHAHAHRPAVYSHFFLLLLLFTPTFDTLTLSNTIIIRAPRDYSYRDAASRRRFHEGIAGRKMGPERTKRPCARRLAVSFTWTAGEPTAILYSVAGTINVNEPNG